MQAEIEPVIIHSANGTTIHSVVPIGGAPFIQPFKSMVNSQFDQGTSSSSSSFLSTRNSISSGTRKHRNKQISSPTNSPTISTSHLSDSGSDSSLSTSSSPTSAAGFTNWEAALRYTTALHEHTRKMWEQERLSIERARLGLPPASNEPLSPMSSSSSPLQKRSTLSGMDGFLRGRSSKRQPKRASISG